MSYTALGFSVLTVFCWAVGAIFDKLAVRHLPPAATFYSRFYLLFILLLPLLVLQWDPTRRAFLMADRNAVFFVLGSVAFTVSGLFFYFHALSGLDASQAIPLCASYPLLTFFLSLFFLGESFTWSKLMGTLMVVGGIFCLTR
ncbi:MAG: EamA family transporter [Elusimicrobia bacterium]|nr:EamA family transporter [Elusimicrobiota bacterium]